MEHFGTEELLARVRRVSIYSGALESPAVRALCRALEKPGLSTVTAVFTAAAQSGFPGFPCDAAADAALYDDNVFTRALSRGEGAFLPESVTRAALFDLATLEALSRLTPADFGLSGTVEPPDWESRPAPAPLLSGWAERTEELEAFYRRGGTGLFARHRAFIWGSGNLSPVKNPDPIRFSDLTGYERERGIVTANVTRFLEGRPANHMLLYGDKGTGKSATVHCLVNEYGERGLRLIELSKDSLSSLPALSEQIKSIPLRFLLFIDDLTFSESDGQFAALKAVLEGSLEVTPENCLICATSNRRHLVKELHADRAGDDLHRADTLQEQQALSDRFGLTVTFLKPGRDDYLRIIETLAREQGIKLPAGRLFAEAERWALARGGRSPRAAVQFLRSLERE